MRWCSLAFCAASASTFEGSTVSTTLGGSTGAGVATTIFSLTSGSFGSCSCDWLTAGGTGFDSSTGFMIEGDRSINEGMSSPPPDMSKLSTTSSAVTTGNWDTDGMSGCCGRVKATFVNFWDVACCCCLGLSNIFNSSSLSVDGGGGGVVWPVGSKTFISHWTLFNNCSFVCTFQLIINSL